MPSLDRQAQDLRHLLRKQPHQDDGARWGGLPARLDSRPVQAAWKGDRHHLPNHTDAARDLKIVEVFRETRSIRETVDRTTLSQHTVRRVLRREGLIG